MDLSAAAMQIMQTLGFRNILMLFGAIGVIMILWLAISLPGEVWIKTLLRLFCLAGMILLIVILPMRARIVMPTPVIRLICFTVSVMILLIILQMARSCLLLPSGLLAIVWKVPWTLVISRGMSMAVMLGGIILGGLAFWNTLRVPEVKEINIPIADLPEQLDGYHIVQLSDLHLGTIFDQAWMQNVVDRVLPLNADLIAVTGDVGEFAPPAIESALLPLAQFHAPDGVYYALGNHESYQGINSWVQFYNSGGKLLRNSHVRLNKNGAILAVAGLDDANPDVVEAMTGVPDGATTVVLAHRPGMAPFIAAEGAQLQLAGHTHGGLVPGIKSMVAKSNRGFVSGLYNVNNMWLYVSNGTGLWTYVALRLWTPSEITSLRLVKQL